MIISNLAVFSVAFLAGLAVHGVQAQRQQVTLYRGDGLNSSVVVEKVPNLHTISFDNMAASACLTGT